MKQAMKLTTLGVRVERERSRLKRLAERGVPYTDPRMLEALECFKKADAEWKRLEAERQALKDKLTSRETK